MALRRRLLPAAVRQMYRDAGPPTRWVLVAFVAAGFAALLVASLPIGAASVLAAVVAILIVTIPAIVDIDGWRVRLGMAWLATEQRRRATSSLPRTPAEAERMLTKDVAGPLERASALMTAGRPAEARALIDSAPTETPEDRARIARMRAALDGIESGVLDPGPALAAIERLPPDVRRYHRISLAWSTAWVDSSNRRPWRHAFADESRSIRPRDVPTRMLMRLAIDELLATVVVGGGLLLARLVGWL